MTIRTAAYAVLGGLAVGFCGIIFSVFWGPDALVYTFMGVVLASSAGLVAITVRANRVTSQKVADAEAELRRLIG